jgi:DNA repair protein RadC
MTSRIEDPMERCLQFGAECLSLRECVSLLISSTHEVNALEVSGKLVELPGRGMAETEQERAFFLGLEATGPSYLKSTKVLDARSQSRILAAFEMGRRYHRWHANRLQDQPGSNLSVMALDKIPYRKRSASKEWLGFVPCYSHSEVGELCIVEYGVRTHVNIDPAEFFARLLPLRPKGFFLFHNHPSGQLYPSGQDLVLTEQMSEIASQFNILMAGHWIVSAESEYWIPPVFKA